MVTAWRIQKTSEGSDITLTSSNNRFLAVTFRNIRPVKIRKVKEMTDQRLDVRTLTFRVQRIILDEVNDKAG